MLQELQKRMKELHMVCPGDVVLAGVSGGADSVCLLVALQQLQDSLEFALEVIHVEHGIRGEESKADAGFVRSLCESLDVPCHMYEVDVPAFAAENGFGLEEAARMLRYEIFERVAREKNAKIALAHHKEDNAETVLFQMVRGSSLPGLCGMQPLRKDANGICYIRPLLFSHREEIEAFLRECEKTWCVDSTNVDWTYSRNFLRGKVIPDLQEINAQAVNHINQTAAHLSEIQDYIAFESAKIWNQLAQVGDKITLDGKKLLELHPVMQREIVYKAIVQAAGRKKDITSTHVADVISICKGQSGKRISLPYDVVVWKEFEFIHLGKAAQKESTELVYEVPPAFLEQLVFHSSMQENRVGDFSFRVFENREESLEIPRKTYTKWMDYDKIKNGFCIRTRRSGDYFISDDQGHRKKLKSYFIDEKIPLEERDKWLLLAQDSEVLWLVGGRISENVKVSQKTKYILEITYDREERHE